MSVNVNFVGVRIEKGEVYQGQQYTIVSAPAPDAFSHPSRYRVTSDRQLGQIGQLIDLDCMMKGVVRGKSYTDKQTGQQKNYDESTVYFDVYAVRPHVSNSTLAIDGIKKSNG